MDFVGSYKQIVPRLFGCYRLYLSPLPLPHACMKPLSDRLLSIPYATRK